MREIELKPSRRLGLLLAGMAALALIAVWATALPTLGRAALSLVTLGLARWGWRRVSRPVCLRIGTDGGLQTLDDAQEWRDVEVLGDSFVSPALIVLRYRLVGGPVRALTLLPDSADADSLRRLRVSLRWAPRTRSDTSSPGAG